MAWLDNNLPNCKDRIITLLWNNEYVSCSGEVLYLKEWAVIVNESFLLMISNSLTQRVYCHFKKYVKCR